MFLLEKVVRRKNFCAEHIENLKQRRYQYADKKIFTYARVLEDWEKFKEALANLPNPGQMPCEKALELMLAMHKENRRIETQEEATAYEHFGVPYSCERNKARAMLSRP